MKLQKLDVSLLNLVVVFEARGIKGMTPFWVAEAAKQLVICVRSRKKSTLILIVYHHLWLQRDQCMNKKFALIRSPASLIICACRLCVRGILDTGMSRHVCDCYCEAKVRSSSVSVVFVVRLRI